MSNDYEMKRPGLNRGSSLFGADPQTQLLNSVRQHDFRVFKKLVQSDTVDPGHFYEYPDYKTCLDIACCSSGTAEFIKLLLDAHVDINKINETHRKAPIHFAAETGDVDCVRVLLNNKNLKINSLSKSNTALQLAIKKVKAASKDVVRQYEDVIELLLKHGIDVNIPDMKNSTAILFAAKSRLENVVKIVLQNSKTNVDLDSHEDTISQKTARTYIEDYFPHLLEDLPEKADQQEERVVDKNKLFALLNAHEEDKFVDDVNSMDKSDLINIINDNNGYFTMLQSCCDHGLDRAVDVLLKNGAEPNKMAPGSNGSPIGLACTKGYYKILRLLSDIDSTSLEPINGDSLIQIVIKEAKQMEDEPNVDYSECLKILMENSKVDTNVNHMDIKGNTALHYAARSGDHETVIKLLEKGACIGLRNVFSEPPLADISAKTLETYLDNCLTTNGERPNDEDYEIQFNYSFLVPPVHCSTKETKVPLMDNSDVSQSANDRFLAPETDALLYMTRCNELKPLLKHPVITSFLFLKWQRISCLFYANITFYALFWLSLILYILLGYADEDPMEKRNETTQIVGDVTHVTTIIGWIVLALRELSQMFVTPRRYIKSFENWLEVCLIVVTAVIVFNDSAKEETKQQLSAIAILLSSAELVLLIGQFPTLSTNIVMLKTVSWNFFKFLLWYCILIIAFALSFYTLFRKEKSDSNNESVPYDPNKQAADDNDEPNFFLDPGISLFKTIVMLTGEFDASSINFESFPITSHIIFVIFVFMIPIVLFNLLNGLAVSDTQAIKANAELVGHISRIKLISYFESVLLGDMSPYKSAVSNMQSACCWLPGNNCVKSRMIIIKPLARRICLFPNFLPNAQIGVLTNQSSKVVIHKCDRSKKKQQRDDDATDLTFCCLRRCNETIMDRKVVKAARMLLAEREDGGSELNQIKHRLENVEKVLEEILKSVTKK